MTQPDIRTAAVTDQDAVFRIHEELFREYIDQIWGWDDKWQIENFRSEWREVHTVTIYEAGGLIGYMQTSDKQDHIYISNLAICPGYQSKGLGTEIIERLKRRNTTLRLGVFRANDRALSFYLRNGFRITAETATVFKLEWEPQQGKQGSGGFA